MVRMPAYVPPVSRHQKCDIPMVRSFISAGYPIPRRGGKYVSRKSHRDSAIGK